jgi:hypothetical protein
MTAARNRARLFQFTSLFVLVAVIIRIGVANYPSPYYGSNETNTGVGKGAVVAMAYDYEADTDDAFDYDTESDSESNPDTVDDFLPSDLNYLLTAGAIFRGANPGNPSGRSPPPEHRPPCHV